MLSFHNHQISYKFIPALIFQGDFKEKGSLKALSRFLYNFISARSDVNFYCRYDIAILRYVALYNDAMQSSSYIACLALNQL